MQGTEMTPPSDVESLSVVPADAAQQTNESRAERDGDVSITYSGAEEARFSWQRLLMFAGPGLLISIAYVDPGNLESDLQTGYLAGYSLAWLIVWSTVLGFIVQLLAVRLGVVTHKHLALHCRAVYPAVPRYVLWLMAEIAIIGSDIQEVIGSAIAINLLGFIAFGVSIPLWAGVLITGVDTFLLLTLERLGVRWLEAFFAVLVATMTMSFGWMYVKADCDTVELLKGAAVPTIQSAYFSTALGIVGSLVMPHNIFLHSSLVLSRKIDTTSDGAKSEAIKYNAVESAVSLAITVVINLSVMSVFAAGFHGKDIDDVGLSTAGRYLGEEFGQAMEIIWAIGLFAAGQSSTMTGTYTGQFVMSGFLNLHVSPFKRALITRSVAMVPTLLVAVLCAGSNSIDLMNQALNVLQSVQLPFALLPVLYISTREHIMGTKFVLKSFFRIFVQGICGVLLVINLYVASTTFTSLSHGHPGLLLLTVVVCAVYAAFVAYLLIGPHRVQHWLAMSENRVAVVLRKAFGRQFAVYDEDEVVQEEASVELPGAPREAVPVIADATDAVSPARAPQRATRARRAGR
eukprot:TRINITY_DN4074_c0_g1_i1.p1 TRINITY_DN4074_c0_g1~~TRINITY_DN4074_c0_g1_i1.p1  ORF type:complete len:657 (-),score=91.20 TRINITY_DN4074_c0_g1_i1:420-2138(-)